jgi:hypothetical protein
MRPRPTPTISASGPSGPRLSHQAEPSEAGDTRTSGVDAPREPASADDTRKNTRSELDLLAVAARFMSRLKVHGTWALNRESEAAPMLPPFIIDQIRRREEEERRRIEREQPRVELPVDAYRPAPRPQSDADEPDDPERGVVILDLG